MSAHGGTCGRALKRRLEKDVDVFCHRSGSTAVRVGSPVFLAALNTHSTHSHRHRGVHKQAGVRMGQPELSHSCLVTPLLAV